MATFISPGNWTNEGAHAAKETVARPEGVTERARGLGGKLRQTDWTMSGCHVIAMVEVPGEETATAIALGVASAGMIRGETLPAFAASEMTDNLARVG